MSVRRTGRVDFHLHSYASNVTDYYAVNTFAIPESYSDPIATYRELRRQGMTLFTLTDHNSIDGVKELLDAQLPGVFVSAEMTATFPEDGCNIHVTVANMTETQFAEIDRLRGNLYEMLDYVDREIAADSHLPTGSARDPALAVASGWPPGNRLAYFMTHPLMSTQNRPYGREGSLTAEHIEKALLLFECLEVRNGTRTRALNEFTQALLRRLDRETIERLANKHGLVPKGRMPWIKALVAGSDDHSGINPGRTWTEFPLPEARQPVPNDIVDAIRTRTTSPGGAHGGPVCLAHAMVKLIHDGSSARHRRGPGRSVGIGGPIHDLLRFVFDGDSLGLRYKLAFQGKLWFYRLLDARARRRSHADQSFEKLLASEARQLLGDPRFKTDLAALTRTDDRIFRVVSSLVNRILQRYVERIRRATAANLVRIVKEAIAMVSSNVLVSLPYLISYLHQSSDRLILRDLRGRFDLRERQKLVLVTDTFFDVNGVSRTIRRMLDEGTRRGIDLTVVTCLAERELAAATADPVVAQLVTGGRLHILPAIVDFGLPEYKGLQLRVPPFLELLRFVQEQGFTKMQISTPGSVGVAGLLAAKLLQIETAATYHTSFPEYVEDYTRDISLEALAWKYMIFFYHSVDEVVVPSKYIARLLHQRGLRNRKLLILDRWVDTHRFAPAQRIDRFWHRFGVAAAERKVKFLYVGRLGLEKNLDVMMEAFRRLCATESDLQLILVGDGPYRTTLAERADGLPCTFTGFLDGDDLSAAYASADVKLFPSTTDTWGNAPLEAQASGLPVVVSDKGGPHELMIDGVTGYRVRGRDVEDLLAAMRRLLDPATRIRLGRAARQFAERGVLEEPFSAILDSERYRSRSKAGRRADGSNESLGVTRVERVEDHLIDHREALGQVAER